MKLVIVYNSKQVDFVRSLPAKKADILFQNPNYKNHRYAFRGSLTS